MADDCTIMWLGLSGAELRSAGQAILIDPVYTHVPLPKAVFGSIEPDEHAVRRGLRGCAAVFVTHAHHDHLLDAPLVCRLAGAPLHASENACAIARACGAPEHCLRVIGPGETVEAGAFRVTALRATHIRLPGFGEGPVRPGLRPPLRAWHYRMDGSLVFLVRAGRRRLLVGPGLCLGDPGPVDGLLFSPLYARGGYAEYLTRVRPAFVLPVHWEGLFRPEGRAPRPGLAPGFPPRRVRMGDLQREAEALGIRYLQPEIGREYSVAELME